ncbi:MAG: ABC transporter permease subunit [Coriobacteriia bacterium]|nr:ABC transporter permease subunit [Coriobacteriia bacterium]
MARLSFAHVRSRFWMAACWVSAAVVLAVCAGIVLAMAARGIGALEPSFFTTDPQPSFEESLAGGIRAPLAGSVILAVSGILAVFLPSLGAAIYLAEYMDEQKLGTRAIRLGLEVLAGVPSVVFGFWGLAVFSQPIFAFLSDSAGGDATSAFGRSFLVGALVMAVHILPFVVKVMEEAIRAVPRALREAGYALGLTKWRMIKRVVLPSAAPGIVTAIVLGLGLIVGDTAIVWLTVGGTMTMSGADAWWLPHNWLPVLKGTGSTLTTFIFYSSPAGEGNAPGKAYGAAFVLLALVVALNAFVAWIGRQRSIKAQ